jgi:hypothetical protein
MELEFMLFAWPLKTDTERAENLQVEAICIMILNLLNFMKQL